MTARPFHHGNLRAALLDQAQVTLRSEGVEGLSLRELARQLGVSHGAPRSHFIDRQALLEALAEQGFDRLAENIARALHGEATLEERFRRLGRAYVDFAVEDAALMELMFATKADDPNGPVQRAAARLFQVLDEALGTPAESAPSSSAAGGHSSSTAAAGARSDFAIEDARVRFKLLFAATMQGTATLIAARRISREQGRMIVDDASDALLSSALGAAVLPDR